MRGVGGGNLQQCDPLLIGPYLAITSSTCFIFPWPHTAHMQRQALTSTQACTQSHTHRGTHIRIHTHTHTHRVAHTSSHSFSRACHAQGFTATAYRRKAKDSRDLMKLYGEPVFAASSGRGLLGSGVGGMGSGAQGGDEGAAALGAARFAEQRGEQRRGEPCRL